MTFPRVSIVLPLAVLLLTTACASTPEPDVEDNASGLLGLFGAPPADLEDRIAKAAAHPLGSQQNPVRVFMPEGERAYLDRLRCADGKAPTYERTGSYGTAAFGHVIDGYDVKCEGSQPAQSMIFMDMYFGGYVESRAPEGFTIVPE